MGDPPDGERHGERSPEQPPPMTSGAPEDAAPEHHAEGLDFARSASRAAAASPGSAARKKKTGPSRRRTFTTSSGARPDDRDPQLLDEAMGRLVANHGWELDLKVQGVFGRWAELVGDDVAAHCTPESFADGRLVVRTDSTAWATQLKLLTPTVVRRLNTELGHNTVTVIEVLGPHLPSWKKGKFGTRDGRGPRDTYG